MSRQIERDRPVVAGKCLEDGIPHPVVERESVQEDESRAGVGGVAVPSPGEISPADAGRVRLVTAMGGGGVVHVTLLSFRNSVAL